MPIYAYKCANCGHQLDVLQKVSDSPLTVCPSCGVAALTKQVTAAGFQLKGSGWYVTDFRDGDKKKDPVKPDAATAASGDGDAAVKDGAKAAAGVDAKTETKSDGPKSDAPAGRGANSGASSGASDSTPASSSAKASADTTVTKTSPPATGGAKGTPG
jgi:putative FmdB family regulatory protein